MDMFVIGVVICGQIDDQIKRSNRWDETMMMMGQVEAATSLAAIKLTTKQIATN